MAHNTGSHNAKRVKRTIRDRFAYFFINGELCKKIVIQRPADRIIAWNYPQHKQVTYVYSDVIRRHEKAYYQREVRQMVNRGYTSMWKAVDSGMVERPQGTYNINGDQTKITRYMWREKDIMALLEYFAQVHRGKPRDDGIITPAQNLPTPRELLAQIRNDNILYVKQGDIFVPSWRAKEF